MTVKRRGRIICGEFKGRILDMPDSALVRPTTDAFKEMIFNVLEHSLYVDFGVLNVIDVCAGSGALGLEAISRGAVAGVFIDNNPISLMCIKNNVQKLGIMHRAKIINGDVKYVDFSKFAETSVVFVDPPYANKDIVSHVLDSVMEYSKSSVIVVESDDDIEGRVYTLKKTHSGKVALFFVT
jgi:16S rRNA (guanine966-N2)-methyltransferase